MYAYPLLSKKTVSLLFPSTRKFCILNSIFQFCPYLSTHHDKATKALQIFFDHLTFVKNLRWRPRKNFMTAHGKPGWDKELILCSSPPPYMCQRTHEESPSPLHFFALTEATCKTLPFALHSMRLQQNGYTKSPDFQMYHLLEEES